MADAKPLWQVMCDASVKALFEADNADLFAVNCRIAAELRAIAAWISQRHPLEPESPSYVGARLVAAQLLVEADRAERGDVEKS